MYKPLSGDFYAQIMLQRHFYTAGLAVYITLGVTQHPCSKPSDVKDKFAKH